MKALLPITLLFFIATYSQGQSSSYTTQNGVAIKGYDAVAYFTDNAAVLGVKQYSYIWQGAEWHFKNQAHLDAFKASPQKYAPQFGGYCAYGVSQNHKAPTEPTAFTIIDGKLYLNYNDKVKETWRKDTKNNIEKAQTNWVMLKDKN
jgi:hypothetical protein